MNKGRISIKCCHDCKPVFVDGVQDLNFRSHACWDRCERYKQASEKIHRQKQLLKAPEHADYLRSRKLVKGQI